MKQLFVSFALLSLFLASCSKSSYTTRSSSRMSTVKKSRPSSSPQATLVKFERSGKMSDAISKAKSSGKYIFLDFYTDYCPPCKVMDKEVFGDRQLANYLNENFINVKVNAGKTDGANLASLYSVSAYPTLIFADEHGNALMRKEGGTSISTVRYMAEEVLRATAMK